MLLRRVPNFFCRNLHDYPKLPKFYCFIHSAARLAFCIKPDTSQPRSKLLFKRKHEMFPPIKTFSRPIRLIRTLFLGACGDNCGASLCRPASTPQPLHLIRLRLEVFRVLRRNIRGQHINFYSRVIHKAKNSIKSVLLSLAEHGSPAREPESMIGGKPFSPGQFFRSGFDGGEATNRQPQDE